MPATYSTAYDLVVLCGETELLQLGLDTQAEEYDADIELAASVADGNVEPGATEATLLLASRLRQVVSSAQGRVAAYVEGRYPSLPVVPEVLRDAANAIARRRLYARREADAPAIVQDDYDDAITFLQAVAAGRASLPVESGGTAAGGAPATRARTGLASLGGVEMSGIVY